MVNIRSLEHLILPN